MFGDYIHKYYYNLSIKDGYTLRLIREEIETNYKLTLQEHLERIKVLEGDADKKKIYAASYVCRTNVRITLLRFRTGKNCHER